MALLERELARDDTAGHPDLRERLEAEFIASTWWVPETFPLAAARLEELDLDNLHGGFGSDLLLADATFYECRLATDRPKAIALARRSLVSGELAESGALGFQFASFSLVSTGLFDEAIAAYDAAHSSAERRGDLLRAAPIAMFRGRAKLLRGDLDTALAELRDALERVTALRIARRVPVRGQLPGRGAARTRRAGRGRGDARRRRPAGRAAGQRPPLLLPVRARPGADRDRRRAARRRRPDGAGRADARRACRSTTRVDYPWRRFVAAGLHQLGRHDEALAMADENLELARRWAAPSALGAALRDQRRADAAAARARRCCARRSTSSPARTRGSSRRARSSSSARRCAAATTAARRATCCARASSSPTARALRRSSPAATRSSPPPAHARGRSSSTGLESLTASERRVAELAAQDHPNKEIAQALFVTVKTVEVHLSSVYRKLGIASRRQLAAALEAVGSTE